VSLFDDLKTRLLQAETCQGDVKQFQASDHFRIRVGDYRVRFKVLADGTLKIVRVLHRKDAYRD
jgi:mRNA-degrading endonuclease RelE of RelBE toxin-antitoxin system